VFNKLIHYFQINNIQVPALFGFRKGMFTENATFAPIKGALKSISKERHVGGIFCDIVKTSDCANHEILLSYTFLTFNEKNAS
jgi:hypothetical protein